MKHYYAMSQTGILNKEPSPTVPSWAALNDPERPSFGVPALGTNRSRIAHGPLVLGSSPDLGSFPLDFNPPQI